MIKQITINNFQSHQNTTLKLTSGVNVIIGSSDSGKSAILRALKWVIYAKPKGDAMCSWWGGETGVCITFDDCEVLRTKNGNDNEYVLTIDNKPKSFRAFGNDIPNEITEAINIDEINFQKQGDAPFLISNTSGEVAGHFNRMANLEKIDNSIRFIQSEIKTTEQTIKFKKQEYSTKLQQYKQYNYISDVEIMVENIEDLETKKLEIQTKINILTSSIQSIEITDNKIKALQYTTTAFDDIMNIVALFERKNSLQDKVKTIHDNIVYFENLNKKIKWSEHYVNAEKPINDILKLYDERKEIKRDYKDLTAIIQTIKTHSDTIKEQEEKVIGLETKYKDNLPDTCPLCEQKIPHKH